MAIRISKLFGTDKLVGTDDDDLLIALGAKTTLIGGAGKDVLLGGLNNDILIGGEGADLLSGGLGTDTADYSASSAGVTVNLATGKGYGGDAQGDTLISIEKVIGSAFDDTFIGSVGNNSFTGGAGKDVFVMSAGNDVITDFSPIRPVLIDFETNHGISPIPSGYAGMSWDPGLFTSDLFVGDGPSLDIARNSGTQYAVNYFAQSEFSFSSNAGDFDFKSGYFSRFGPTVMTIEAWDDGILAGTSTIDIGSSKKSFINFQAGTATNVSSPSFTGRFTSIDTVKVILSVDRDIGMDDLLVDFGFGGGDKIDVPDGTNVAALAASAVSNGSGGTLLTHAGGTLNLVGVDPGAVSADWFI